MTREALARQRLVRLGIAGCYLVAMVAVPFVGDKAGTAPGLLLWLGGSFLAGILLVERWMYLIPVVAFAILFVGGVLLGLFTNEFFADPLSALALLPLLAGEVAGLAAGSALGAWWWPKRTGP